VLRRHAAHEAFVAAHLAKHPPPVRAPADEPLGDEEGFVATDWEAELAAAGPPAPRKVRGTI
jgi:hypothetical protein